MHRAGIYLNKTIGVFLLISILQTYVCSFLCASESLASGRQKEMTHDCCSKSNNQGAKHHDEGNCQKDHLAFFQTISQFHSKDHVSASSVMLQLEPIELRKISVPVVSNGSHFTAFTGFHPPPPKDGIPVLVQSFLI